jgi:hypothetical protein
MEVSFEPRPLYPKGKSFQYLLDRRFGGLQSRSRSLARVGNVTRDIQPLARLYTD